MQIILLSGGSGKRLWPLSNDTRSKQFLKVLKNENSHLESMVQRVWGQLKKAGLDKFTSIATSKLQQEMIQSQLGDNLSIITEPDRRDTFPAISLAASYLYSVKQVSLDETVIVLPVDPYVSDAFFERIKHLEGVLEISNAELALIGVEPTYPSSKYGYIIPNDHEAEYFSVEKFQEKPSEEVAQKLIEKNALWNCGVFAFKLDFLLEKLSEHNLPSDYEELINQYEQIPKISFDYEVVEKANSVVVLPYDGYWKDLGTWNTLTEEMSSEIVGNGIISDDSLSTHLINELEIPITVLGVNNLVVAASPDGILISDKSASPRIKEYVQEFDNPPMYEERQWGWSRTLDFVKYGSNEEVITKRICILKDKNSTYHYHNLRDEVWTIVRGEGELVLDGQIRRVKAGDVVHIPIGKKHAIKAIEDLEFIEVQTGSNISSEDINRLTSSWDEVINIFKSTRSSLIM